MTDVEKIILEELKTIKKDLKDLNETTTTLKVKFGAMAVVFGLLGSFIKPFITLFLGGHK